ncbi:uncharacterized protein LOC108621959 [Ceratina calcarata]|uniref:Uncharacterized protein LOC108621959 n=1 Tax=Ceratina calcarata TaxID=156304 RepID=A0AAJ7RWB2_9HYME|nr:uncharacterized protein LOC108621959 [Ceratina calcarata]
MKSLFIFGVAILAVANCVQSQIVATEKGQIQGSINVSVKSSVKYSSFQGIPYAKPPVGNLRFKESQEAEAWTHVMDCTKPKPVCLQRVGNSTYGDEDCLYVDVHSPVTDLSNIVEKKAVLVWIYDAGLMTGYGVHDQLAHEFFVEKDMVVVKVAHRLDALGYLALNAEGAKGNAGLKDQNLALKWVQKNIEKFGGDAGRVTLFGEGTSSAHVGYHMLLPQSKGLFHKTIHHSGSPLCPWAFKKRNDAIQQSEGVGALFGFSAYDHEQLLTQLQGVSAADLLNKIHATDNYLLGPLALKFTVTVEDWLTASPIELLQGGNLNSCPSMIGFNKNEAFVLNTAGVDVLKTSITSSLQYVSNILPGIIDFALRNFVDLLINAVQQEHTIETSVAYYFSCSVDLMQRYFVNIMQDIPVFYYRLSLETEDNLHELYDSSVSAGAQLSQDVSVLFGHEVAFSASASNTLNQWREKMVGIWVSFARDFESTGGISASATGGVQWQASGSVGAQMDIGSVCSLGGRLLSSFYTVLEKVIEVCLTVNTSSQGIFALRSTIFWFELMFRPVYKLTGASSIFSRRIQSAKMKDLFVFGIVLLAAVANCVQSQVVQTEKGAVSGSISLSVSGSFNYTSFRGIPYAQPPVGKLRFKESVEAEAWSHVLDCTKPKPVCLQHVGNGTTAGEEDCLYVDVHTPHTSFESFAEKKAVLVWIYGSGFLTGYGLQDQNAHEFFLEHDVVLVKVAHRLDVLGYLATDVKGATGNAGLKDQNLALKWVQKNIEKFGGDAGRVTLFGEGSSSAHVGYHMALPQSKGLFHKTIHHSGSPLCPWAFKSRSELISAAGKLAELFGAAAGASHEVILETLQKVSAETLVQSVHALSLLPGPLSVQFGVTIEEWLTSEPAKLFKNGNINSCPVMLGFNQVEAILITAGTEALKNAVSSSIQGISKAIPLLEFGIRTAIDGVSNIIEDTHIVETSTAYYYSMAIDLMQKYLVQVAGSIPVYFYRMSLETEQNLHELYDGAVQAGEEFTADFSVLYGRQVQFSKKVSSALNQMRSKVVGMWVSFAKDSESAISASVTGGVKWVASGYNGNQLDIGKEFSMGLRFLNPIFVAFEGAYEFVLSLGSVTSSVISGISSITQFGHASGHHIGTSSGGSQGGISIGGQGGISGGSSGANKGGSQSGSNGGSSSTGGNSGSGNNGSKGGSSGNGGSQGGISIGGQGGTSGNGGSQGGISFGGQGGTSGGSSGSSKGGSHGGSSSGSSGSGNNGSKGGSSGNGGSQGGISIGGQGGTSGNGGSQGGISFGGQGGTSGGSSGSSKGGSHGGSSSGSSGSGNNGSKGGSSGNGGSQGGISIGGQGGTSGNGGSQGGISFGGQGGTSGGSSGSSKGGSHGGSSSGSSGSGNNGSKGGSSGNGGSQGGISIGGQGGTSGNGGSQGGISFGGQGGTSGGSSGSSKGGSHGGSSSGSSGSGNNGSKGGSSGNGGSQGGISIGGQGGTSGNGGSQGGISFGGQGGTSGGSSGSSKGGSQGGSSSTSGSQNGSQGGSSSDNVHSRYGGNDEDGSSQGGCDRGSSSHSSSNSDSSSSSSSNSGSFVLPGVSGSVSSNGLGSGQGGIKLH